MKPASQHLLTVEDLYSFPDDGRVHELVAGRLVSEPLPAPRHGRVAAALVARLDGFVRPRRLGVVLANDTGFILSRKPDTVRGPDVAFVSRERYAELQDETRAFPGHPDLAVEVVSPSNTPFAIHAKVADYLAAGTPLVWVLDPNERQATVYRSLLSPRVVAEDEELEGEGVLAGFRLVLREIFEL